MAQEVSELEQLENAMRSFFQAMKRPQRWNDVIERLGFTIDRPSAMIIQTLRTKHGNGCRVQDLALQLGIEAPSVTRKTQELEAVGYVRRTQDDKDKRVVTIQLTDDGNAVGKKIWEAQRSIMSQALDGWNKADREQLASLLQRFSDDLSRTTGNTHERN